MKKKVLEELNKRLQGYADEFGEIGMDDVVRVLNEFLEVYPEHADAIKDEFWYNLTEQ